MRYLYYAPQDEWGADDYYALYRFMDRMFSSNKEHRDDEILALDLDKMSFETKYLMKHLLILQSNFKSSMYKYKNLHGLMKIKDDDLKSPIILRDDPHHSYAYFKRHNIYL